MRFLRRVSFLGHVPDEPWANRKLMSPDHSVPTTIGGYRDRHRKRIEVRFLDFLLSDICVWQECPESVTLFIRFCSPSDGSMDTLAMVADSKVFIVARNKHLVPKRRRVERLPSGYSV